MILTTLVLIRHGQSLWNAENKFTGWTDIGLSEVERITKRMQEIALSLIHI